MLKTLTQMRFEVARVVLVKQAAIIKIIIMIMIMIMIMIRRKKCKFNFFLFQVKIIIQNDLL